MLVTNIELYQKGKYKIYLNDEFAFALYRSELRSFSISIGSELTQDIYDTILDEVLGKRAKSRTLHLLEKMDRTEYQIRSKLRENFYPERVINQAIAYAKNYRYIDDTKYANNYINLKMATKSKKQVSLQLQQKGIASHVVTDILQNNNFDEKETIKKLILKKHIDINTAEKDVIQKLKMYLIRKGFSFEDCNEALREIAREKN